MSIVLKQIKNRWEDLVKLRRQGLTAQNADEHYEKDVRDLMRITEALMKTCCQLNMKWHEAAGKEPLEFTQYFRNFEKAVDRLLIQEGLKVIK